MRRYKMRLILTALLLAHVAVAESRAYPVHDVRRAFVASSERAGASIDLRYIDSMLADIEKHTDTYPPAFDNQEDHRRAAHDIRTLAGTLAKLDPSGELLRRYCSAERLAFEFDIEGAYERAHRCYSAMLKLDPEDGRTALVFGAFLAKTRAGQAQSVEILRRAASLGHEQARYLLAMTFVSRAEYASAEAEADALVRNHPGDARTAEFQRQIKAREATITLR